jgi:hypothetical protein
MEKMPREAVENKPYFRLVATACLKFWILTIERVLHNQSDSKEKKAGDNAGLSRNILEIC